VQYGNDAASLPATAAWQQPPEQGMTAPPPPGAMEAQQMQQNMQQGMLQPAVPQQAGQPAPAQPAGMQQPPPQQQGAPQQYTAQQPGPMPVGQQQGMPLQAVPAQQPVYAQIAPGQQGYAQPAQAPGQLPVQYAAQPPAVSQMPASGPRYMQQGYMPPGRPAPPVGQDMGQTRAYSAQAPLAGQAPAAPAAAAATAAASEVPTSDFQDEWVNCVGLTGTVLQGPLLQQFGATGKVKTSLVLGLLGRTTGEETADKPRPILVSGALLGGTASSCGPKLACLRISALLSTASSSMLCYHWKAYHLCVWVRCSGVGVAECRPRCTAACIKFAAC
jgi:hypothetical protein